MYIFIIKSQILFCFFFLNAFTGNDDHSNDPPGAGAVTITMIYSLAHSYEPSIILQWGPQVATLKREENHPVNVTEKTEKRKQLKDPGR